ncbi:hypothetical protein [Cognatiluteimonas telluris]|uniref:hypothetical protein n=1 Tax=Cognatiluteimonas telluris TaxID=1104775 RepID=UPI00140DFCEF|nr:hypothetical protein [Lysobacter telluris]
MRNAPLIVFGLGLIAGCSQASSPTASGAAAAAAPQASVQLDGSGSTVDSMSSVALATSTCGESTLRLTCSSAAVGTQMECTHPTMRLEQASSARALPQPIEMAGYAPVGLACAHSRSGEAFFVVQFGELPEGCGACEWFYVYSTDGKVLTRSQPPMLGGGTEQSPNNREYDQLRRRMGMSHPTFDYARCDRTADQDGRAVCLKEVKDDRAGDP